MSLFMRAFSKVLTPDEDLTPRFQRQRHLSKDGVLLSVVLSSGWGGRGGGRRPNMTFRCDVLVLVVCR